MMMIMIMITWLLCCNYGCFGDGDGEARVMLPDDDKRLTDEDDYDGNYDENCKLHVMYEKKK